MRSIDRGARLSLEPAKTISNIRSERGISPTKLVEQEQTEITEKPSVPSVRSCSTVLSPSRRNPRPHLRKSAIQGFWPQSRRRGYNPLEHRLSQSRRSAGEHITFNGDYVWPTEPLQNDFRPLRNPRSAFLDAA